ncbi:MAG: hypothetical protein R3D67_15235 [Hyphomicrobiaceae bacterium]
MNELPASRRATLENESSGETIANRRATGPVGAASSEFTSDDDRTLAPLVAQLLALGGDERIAVDARTGRNRYGTSLTPRPGDIWFSSSTATTITPLGHEAALAAATALMTQTSVGKPAGFDLADEVRGRIARLLAAPDAATILAGSGTEAEIIALVIALATMGGPITNIVVAPDETGRGVLTAASGRHFLPTSSLAGAVHKDHPIAGLEDADISTTAIEIRDASGSPLPESQVNAAAAIAVEQALLAGRNVVLHVLDCSKTGLSGVSRDTALALKKAAPGRVMVVVDACQLRAPEAQLKRDIHNGFLIAVTGSKFAAGPAFSGALLLPPALANRLAETAMQPPAGLASLSARADWPAPLRAWCEPALSVDCNVGLVMRWVAALAEIERFRRIDPGLREAIIEAFARAVRQRAAAVLGPGALLPADDNGVPSIVCITVAEGPNAMDQAAALHDALRTAHDVEGRSPDALALARVCHVGQPVKLGHRSVLRVCVSAPLISDIADHIGGTASLEEALQPLAEDLDTLFAKWRVLQHTSQTRDQSASSAIATGPTTSLDPEDWEAFAQPADAPSMA